MSENLGWKLVALFQTLAIGPFFAQFLMLAASPALTRLYTPSEFGEVAMFLLVGTAIGSVACLKLDNSIIRATSSLEAFRIARVAIISALYFAIACSVVAAMIFALGKWTGFTTIITLLIPYVFIGGVYDVMNAIALRRHLAKIVTKGRIVLVFSTLVVQITAGIFKVGTTGFVLGLVVGYLCCVIYLIKALRIKPTRFISFVGADKYSILARNRHDLIYGAPAALFYTLQNNIPAVVLSVFAGAAVGGYYVLIQRVIFNPVIVVTGVLSQSILPWLSGTRDKYPVVYLAKISSLIAIFLIGTTIILYPTIEPLFAFFFGEPWREAGVYASLLFLFLPYKVLYDVLSILLISENQQGTLFITRGLALLLGVGVLIVFSTSKVSQLFFMFSFVQAVCALAGIYTVISVLTIPINDAFRTMIIGLSVTYLIVRYDASFILHFDKNLFRLLFGFIGALFVVYAINAINNEKTLK
jgi:O-antigen/teichoic acid export membrane protein